MSTEIALQSAPGGRPPVRWPAAGLLAIGVWTLLVGVVSAGIAVHITNRRMDEELVMRPPVVVVNSLDWIQHAGTGHTMAERYASGAAHLDAAIAALRKHGALVLDSSVVHTYPAAVSLAPPPPLSGGR